MAVSAETATERVVVLMTTQQKAAVTRKARLARVPVGEFMRRRALEDDESAELDEVLKKLQAATARASEGLDRTIARLDRLEVELPQRMEAARQEALAEVSGLDADAVLAEILDGPGVQR